MSPYQQTDPRRNDLLAGLSAESYARLLPDLESMSLTLGDVLSGNGDKFKYAYFPDDSIISMIYKLADGATVEIAVIGREGMAGVALVMGGETSPSETLVQHTGHGHRLNAAALIREFARGGDFQDALLHFIQALITQTSQTAVCNRFHTVEQQLCRWLLLCVDRLPTDQVDMTQELMAMMLGVRREGVTRAVGVLLNANLVTNHRGYIRILDRPGVELRTCECYAIVEKAYDRLLAPRTRRAA
ncbi:MAG: Crp/Fnr family transcriptional regulator [Candidatus Acidiferrales bacterium]